jgi:hypothetical protein
MNRAGKMVLPVQYSDAANFRNGLARVELEDGTSAWIDRAGRQVFVVPEVYSANDTMANIRNSTDVAWLKRTVLEPAQAEKLAAEPLARGGILGIRASAYCRLGDLATEESLAAVREIESRATAELPAAPKTWFGSSPAPTFYYDSEEVTALATASGKDGITCAVVPGQTLGDLDAYLTCSRSPNDTGSWTRPKLIPNRLFFGVGIRHWQCPNLAGSFFHLFRPNRENAT